MIDYRVSRRIGELRLGVGVDFKAFLFAWNIALTVGLVFLFKDYHFVDGALYEEVASADGKNSLAIAIELGRLDFLSALLAIIGIMVGLGAIVGYAEVRWRAIEQGRQAAVPAAEGEARKVVDELLPSLVAREVAANIRASNELGREDFTVDEMSEMLQNLNDDGGSKPNA